MAVITPVKLSLTAITSPSATSAEATNSVKWYPGLKLQIKNTDASETIATIVAKQQSDTGETHDATVTVPATSGNKLIGPISERFKDTLGNVNVNLSNATAATILATYHDSVDVPVL